MSPSKRWRWYARHTPETCQTGQTVLRKRKTTAQTQNEMNKFSILMLLQRRQAIAVIVKENKGKKKRLPVLFFKHTNLIQNGKRKMHMKNTEAVPIYPPTICTIEEEDRRRRRRRRSRKENTSNIYVLKNPTISSERTVGPILQWKVGCEWKPSFTQQQGPEAQ